MRLSMLYSIFVSTDCPSFHDSLEVRCSEVLWSLRGLHREIFFLLKIRVELRWRLSELTIIYYFPNCGKAHLLSSILVFLLFTISGTTWHDHLAGVMFWINNQRTPTLAPSAPQTILLVNLAKRQCILNMNFFFRGKCKRQQRKGK